MIILVDMDGVVADLDGGTAELYEETHPGRTLVFPNGRSHAFISKEFSGQLELEVANIIASPGFFRRLPPIDGAIDALYEMKRKGERVYFCTRPHPRNPNSTVEKIDWVAKYFGKEWVGRVIPRADKTGVPGDILIDDNPDADKGRNVPEWEHILYTQPYNLNVEGKRRLTWANWKEVIYSNPNP